MEMVTMLAPGESPEAITPMKFSCGCSVTASAMSRCRLGRPVKAVAALPVSKSKGPGLAFRGAKRSFDSLINPASDGPYSPYFLPW